MESSKIFGGSTKTMGRLALLSAIVILMSFTPLGYLRLTPGLEITLIPIPVTVGAILMGPKAGAFLGAVFGLTSFAQCFGFSPFGAVLLSINPVYTFILTFIPRILMGYLTGWSFALYSRLFPSRTIACGAASLTGPVLNTIFFMTFLIAFFGRTEFIMEFRGAASILGFVVAFVGINGVVEAAVCLIAGTAITRALLSRFYPNSAMPA